MNKSIFLFIVCIVISSCAGTGTKQLKKELVRGEERFNYADKNGQYTVTLSSGFNKKENAFVTKRVLQIPNKETENVLEQSVVFSDLGTIKKKTVILRPKISQYNVWFEGKKYFSELKMNPLEKAISIKMVSPESQWNGSKQVKLPSTTALYCFFSQVMECAKTIGFLREARSNESGTMNFYIIWEGYPYMNETFSDFPTELLSRAQLEYDGKVNDDETRFNLKVGGQSIFYVVNNRDQMKKMFWVSQGISMVSQMAMKNQNKKGKEREEEIE